MKAGFHMKLVLVDTASGWIHGNGCVEKFTFCWADLHLGVGIACHVFFTEATVNKLAANKLAHVFFC